MTYETNRTRTKFSVGAAGNADLGAPTRLRMAAGVVVIAVIGPAAAVLGATLLGMEWPESGAVLGLISGGVGLKMLAPNLF